MDPYGGSAIPEGPQTWNRYSYVANDPVNGSDPTGLNRQAPGEEEPDPIVNCGDIPFVEGGTVRDRILSQSDSGLMSRIIWHESSTISAFSNAPSLATFYQEKETIGLAMLNRYNIAHGSLAVFDMTGDIPALIPPGQTGFGSSSISLREVMLEAVGKGQAWATGKNRILNGSETDLNGASMASINSALNTPYSSGKQYMVHGATGDFSVNAGCYQLIASIQSASAVMSGKFSQSAGSVPVFWNLSSTSNPGNPNWIVNLGTVGTKTNFWGFQYGGWIQ